MIRWKKRLRKWVLFVGTSREWRGDARRDRGRWDVRVDRYEWTRAPTLEAAKAWALRMLREGPERVDLTRRDRMVFIAKDGRVFHHAVPQMERYKAFALPHLPRQALLGEGELPAASTTCTKSIFNFMTWRDSQADERTGVYQDLRLTMFVEAGASDQLVAEVARAELIGEPGCARALVDPLNDFDAYQRIRQMATIAAQRFGERAMYEVMGGRGPRRGVLCQRCLDDPIWANRLFANAVRL